MSVCLTSWILGPQEPQSIEAFKATVEALLDGGMVKGPWLLISGPLDGAWRPLAALQGEALERGQTADQLKAVLGRLDASGDLACVFTGLEGRHPGYAFHHAEPLECAVAVVRLRGPVEVRGEKLHENDESDFPSTVPVSVRSASWLMFEGAHAPYEGELRDSYLRQLVQPTVDILTVAS
jgi:hypothetical protein